MKRLIALLLLLLCSPAGAQVTMFAFADAAYTFGAATKETILGTGGHQKLDAIIVRNNGEGAIFHFPLTQQMRSSNGWYAQVFIGGYPSTSYGAVTGCFRVHGCRTSIDGQNCPTSGGSYEEVKQVFTTMSGANQDDEFSCGGTGAGFNVFNSQYNTTGCNITSGNTGPCSTGSMRVLVVRDSTITGCTSPIPPTVPVAIRGLLIVTP